MLQSKVFRKRGSKFRFCAKDSQFFSTLCNFIPAESFGIWHFAHSRLQSSSLLRILGLQPIPGDPKDNGVAAMFDGRTFCFVIQHGRHAIVFLDLQGMVANQEQTNFDILKFLLGCEAQGTKTKGITLRFRDE